MEVFKLLDLVRTESLNERVVKVTLYYVSD